MARMLKPACLCVCFWCMAGGGCPPAGAGELIVFTGHYAREVDLGGGFKESVRSSDLYSITPDGSARTRLTDLFPYAARQPALSRDGRYMAFTSNLFSFKSFNYEDVFVYDIQASKLTRVTGSEYVSAARKGSVTVTVKDDLGNAGGASSGLLFSFQGCREPLTHEQYAQQGALLNVPAGYVWVKVVKNKWIGASGFAQVPAGGSVLADLGKLSDGNFLAGSPSFSPDGTRIAAISGLAYYDTSAFNYDGTLKEGRSQYGGFDKLVVLDRQGTLIDDNRDTDAIRPGFDSSPSYSPDGSRIAYCQGPITQESIIVVPANNLNGQAAMIATGGGQLGFGSYGFSSPDWSPDGGKIAFVYTAYDASLNLTGNIVVANSDGSNAVQLTNVARNATAAELSFSPDGQWIAYTLITSKGSTLNITDLIVLNITADIYKINISTGESVRLTGDGTSSEPRWGSAVGSPVVPASAIDGSGNTTPDGPVACPFELAVIDPQALQRLREARALLLGKNPRLVAAFYANAAEITAMLTAEPLLREELQALVAENMPSLLALLSGHAVEVDRAMIERIGAFLESLQEDAGQRLHQELGRILADLCSGRLLDMPGVSIEN